MAVELTESGIHVTDLHVSSLEARQYLLERPPEEWDQALVRAIEVGVFCLQRASTAQDIEFVKRQVQNLLYAVKLEVDKIPDELRKRIEETLGTGEGQALYPVRSLIENVKTVLEQRVETVSKLLEDDIDPRKPSSTLGAALQQLKELLDPARKDSVQGQVEQTLTGIVARDGKLTQAVKTAVEEVIKPLKEGLETLTKELYKERGIEEVIIGTPLKGATYEEEVVERLQSWAQIAGAEIEHVGPDKQAGDVLVRFPDLDLRVVIEVRDRKDREGRKLIAETLQNAMDYRGANAGIYLSRSVDGLAKEIGEWSEGALGDRLWVATVDQHLITALRFLVVQARLRQLSGLTADVDIARIRHGIQQVRDSLRSISVIRSRLTSAATDINNQLDSLKVKVEEGLSEVELALGRVSQ